MNLSAKSSAVITCQDSVHFVSLLRDGELGDIDRTRLEAHLQSCPRCQTARQQFEVLYAGLDTLLARSEIASSFVSPQAAPSPHSHAKNFRRRQWLGWCAGAGIGALAGAGATFWLSATALQTAQVPDEAVARRIAQYQALYARSTVQGSPLERDQAQQTLAQWLAQTPSAPRIVSAPRLEAQGLQLVRAQHLKWNAYAILQWVYLPQEGDPVALCGMAASTYAADSPNAFTDSGMRGLRWHESGVLWVLLAPQNLWSPDQLNQLQRSIAPQLV